MVKVGDGLGNKAQEVALFDNDDDFRNALRGVGGGDRGDCIETCHAGPKVAQNRGLVVTAPARMASA